MYISMMTMEKDNFLRTMDTDKEMARSFKAAATGPDNKIDSLHDLTQVRQSIIKATKIIVGLDVMNLSIQPMDWNVPEHVWGKKDASEKFKQTKAEQYSLFSRLSFNLLFIENWTGGYLVRRNADGITWTQTLIMHMYDRDMKNSRAVIGPHDVIVDPRRTAEDGFIFAEDVHSEAHTEILRRGDPAIRRAVSRVQASTVAEALLLMNVKNLEPQRYKVTKAEAKVNKIPRIYEPYCDYRVLDVYRRNAPIQNVKDLVGRVVQQQKNVHRAEGRAHLVRGHYKTIHGELFWWNPFMRNRKRLETHGFADKDYRLIT